MPLRQMPAAAALWRREKMEHVGSRLSMTEGARRGATSGAALGGRSRASDERRTRGRGGAGPVAGRRRGVEAAADPDEPRAVQGSDLASDQDRLEGVIPVGALGHGTRDVSPLVRPDGEGVGRRIQALSRLKKRTSPHLVSPRNRHAREKQERQHRLDQGG